MEKFKNKAKRPCPGWGKGCSLPAKTAGGPENCVRLPATGVKASRKPIIYLCNTILRATGKNLFKNQVFP